MLPSGHDHGRHSPLLNQFPTMEMFFSIPVDVEKPFSRMGRVENSISFNGKEKHGATTCFATD